MIRGEMNFNDFGVVPNSLPRFTYISITIQKKKEHLFSYTHIFLYMGNSVTSTRMVTDDIKKLLEGR
jgi:hypothetical protein